MAEHTADKIHRVRTDSGQVYRFTESDTLCADAPFPSSLAENALAAFMGCHPDFVYFFDRRHRFRYANASLLELWGLSLEEVIGKNFEELGYPPELVDLHETQLELAFAGKTVRGENPYTNDEGRTGYYEYIFVPLPREAGEEIETVAGITRDITRRKQAEDERDFLLSAIVHDLRTPLSVIRTAAEVMNEVADDDRIHTLAERTRRNADRAGRMVEDLLDTSRIRGGGDMKLQRSPGRFDAILREAVTQMNLLYRKDVVLKIAGDGSSFEGSWDQEAVRRIAENLIANALKYGAPNRDVTVRLAREEASVVLEVHNEGEAISADEQTRLFEQFVRSKSPPYRRKGWGIGLTVVQALVEAHGGEVTVHSTPEEGTTFRVRLPVV